MARHTNGFIAGERAARKHDREMAREEAQRRFADFAGHTRHWWDGPPPARLIVEREMEAAVADYRALRPAR